VVSLIAFLLSPVLDNLTTCIVMVSLLRKLVHNPRQRLIYVGMVIIAANTGGAWSPTGDVTTTMLWIGNQVTAKHLVFTLFLPSLACLLVPLAICSFRMKGLVTRREAPAAAGRAVQLGRSQYLVLVAGILVLLCVPFFKMITGLPPFMGILMGLGILWIITEVIGRRHDVEGELSVAGALQRIDTPSILFFLGILLSVGALEATGMLHDLAGWLDRSVGNERVIVTGIGMFSSVVDNVPLVAASQAMYSLDRFPPDHEFWMLLAYTTGSGGSILLIGSAAGVAAMGMEKIDFVWYLKKMTPLALAGFFSGIVVYFLQQYLMGMI
jgi:Na+/H+ antiporter NhaD/arsenite permease-like protein